ncbi:hypothetical protein RHECNPAF_2530034 [Rhizobium etli CNPAF512]|nr:hypothetical protein RHECNPAF_2530034 [Rhizobium etli CNPAF512]
MGLEELHQPLRIILAHGAFDACTLRQRLAPALYALQPVKYAAVAERVEKIEIAEDRCKDGIDEAEAAACEIGPVRQRALNRREFGSKRCALGPQLCRILRRFIAPEIGKHGRTEFHPSAVARARQRIGGMQGGASLRFLQILADDAAFEQYGLAAVRLLDAQQRHLAKRRDFQEPVRLIGKVDVDALERHVLFEQCDRGALHIGAEVMTDQCQLAHGGLLALKRGSKLSVTKVDADAYNSSCAGVQVKCNCIYVREAPDPEQRRHRRMDPHHARPRPSARRDRKRFQGGENAAAVLV